MQENFSPYPPPKGGGLAARSFVKYRMLRDEAEDPKLSRKNIRREEWKSHDFLVDQFWDIDHRYFGDFLETTDGRMTGFSIVMPDLMCLVTLIILRCL